MTPPSTLKRVVGLPGAILMGLGSILGTGIFVSIGLAASIAGSDVLLAVALAAVVAVFNGLSSASTGALRSGRSTRSDAKRRGGRRG